MSLTLTKAVSPRDHAITEFSNKLSHVNGKRWLQESELKTEEIHALHTKFKDDIFQLFRCIEVFSPGEALAMKKEMLLAFSSATLEVKAPKYTKLLNLSELKTLWEKLGQSFLHGYENRIGNALVLNCVGTPIEQERAKVALGKSTHPDWQLALEQTRRSAAHYLEL